ncbi:hypothetical protein GCM10009551_105940 [Nocardiopsis tropica]|nr:hypothetical protein [Tsukamurella sp. TY48]GIZ97123.1 hypothetical protein TTY48_17350 [Tsukamurella sp. TY48]
MLRSIRTRLASGRARTVAAMRLDGVDYEVRHMRLSDFRPWQKTRLRCEDRLAPAFAAEGRTWAEQNDVTSWVEYATPLIEGYRSRRTLPLVIYRRDAHGEEFLGEVGLCGIDDATRSGEMYGWIAPTKTRITPWTLSTAVGMVLEPEYRLDRVIVPAAAANAATRPGLQILGFSDGGRRHALRPYAGAPADHDISYLDNTPENRAAIAKWAKA